MTHIQHVPRTTEQPLGQSPAEQLQAKLFEYTGGPFSLDICRALILERPSNPDELRSFMHNRASEIPGELLHNVRIQPLAQLICDLVLENKVGPRNYELPSYDKNNPPVVVILSPHSRQSDLDWRESTLEKVLTKAGKDFKICWWEESAVPRHMPTTIDGLQKLTDRYDQLRGRISWYDEFTVGLSRGGFDILENLCKYFSQQEKDSSSDSNREAVLLEMLESLKDDPEQCRNPGCSKAQLEFQLREERYRKCLAHDTGITLCTEEPSTLSYVYFLRDRLAQEEGILQMQESDPSGALQAFSQADIAHRETSLLREEGLINLVLAHRDSGQHSLNVITFGSAHARRLVELLTARGIPFEVHLCPSDDRSWNEAAVHFPLQESSANAADYQSSIQRNALLGTLQQVCEPFHGQDLTLDLMLKLTNSVSDDVVSAWLRFVSCNRWLDVKHLASESLSWIEEQLSPQDRWIGTLIRNQLSS